MSCILVKIPLIIVERGTFDQTFQWKAGSPAANVDLSGYTARMDIRTKLNSTSTILSLTINSGWSADAASGIYIDQPTDGKYRIYINDTDTLGKCPQFANVSAVYDLFLFNPSGESVLKQYGTCTILAAVTRSI